VERKREKWGKNRKGGRPVPPQTLSSGARLTYCSVPVIYPM